MTNDHLRVLIFAGNSLLTGTREHMEKFVKEMFVRFPEESAEVISLINHTPSASDMVPLFGTITIEHPYTREIKRVDINDYKVMLEHISRDHKVDAIKQLRSISGWGLKESKDFVEQSASDLCKYLLR